MPKFRLSGDILHPGVIEVEAEDLDAAIAKAEDEYDFVVDDEQNKPLAFKYDGTAWDEDGNEIH